MELEEYPEDQLPLSQLFKARPSASSSLETPLDSDTLPSSKRQKLMIKESRYKKSAAYSSPVMEKAKALQASLGSRHPSFIKFLARSHVTKGFWMYCCKWVPDRFRNPLPITGKILQVVLCSQIISACKTS